MVEIAVMVVMVGGDGCEGGDGVDSGDGGDG